MKKIIKGITIAIVIIAMYGMVTYSQTHYNRQGIVTSIGDTTINVTDTTGNVWSYESNDYNIGDEVTLVMFNGYTDHNIYDDKIIEIKSRG